MREPVKLYKKPQCRTLEQELHITVKELLLIILVVGIFFLFAFITVPQTFGWFYRGVDL